MTNITYIALGIILILGGLLTGFGIPFIKAKLSGEQLNTLKQIINIAVYAAEQLFGAKMGKDKKAFALAYAKKLLAKFGLTFDDEAVDAAIEAQVKEMNDAFNAGGTNE